ncbi:hypothetical protein DY000_02032740 [Brassica cretica]|uniref:Uncharacterized protein n=1 Tax=Brassica cretica TaxID=69181 RepID=A0ABQ7DSR2_BRACR|nr:hypothetical protein DY000_02032740 [Brassica cretica]
MAISKASNELLHTFWASLSWPKLPFTFQLCQPVQDTLLILSNGRIMYGLALVTSSSHKSYPGNLW